MKRSLVIWSISLLFCYTLKAQNDNAIHIHEAMLPQEYLYLVGGEFNVARHGETTRFILADSSYIDLYYYPESDSILFIRSQCAPLCSSFARVYNEQWKLLRSIPTPPNMVLPEAYVENGVLLWRENFRDDESPKD